MACNASGNVLYVTLSSVQKHSKPMHTSISTVALTLFFIFHQHSFHRSRLISFLRAYVFSSFFSRSILWSFFLLVQMLLLLLLGTFDIVAVARIFLRYLLFYINFRLCVIHAQCSYCGKNSIRFRSSIFSHFVSFFFWYIFFCVPFLVFLFLLGWCRWCFFFFIPLANMSV